MAKFVSPSTSQRSRSTSQSKFLSDLTTGTSDLTTGTVLLFKYERRPGFIGLLEGCIRCLTDSRYSHAAFVWVDPEIPATRLHTSLESEPVIKNGKNTGYVKLTGAYIWDSDKHSTAAEDGRKHFGVQLTKMSTYLALKENTTSLTIYRRTPLPPATNQFQQTKKDNCPKTTADEISILTWLYNQYEYKPYDLNFCDWLVACFRCRCCQRNVDSLFCSAFVSMILTDCGILSADTNWKIISPGELSFRPSCGVHWLTWDEKYGGDEKWEWIYEEEYESTGLIF